MVTEIAVIRLLQSQFWQGKQSHKRGCVGLHTFSFVGYGILVIYFTFIICYFHQILMLLLYRPIHRIMCEWFFLVLHTADRGCHSPCKNGNGNNYHITKFEVITTYKQSIDIGWHDSQRTPQFINSGKYLILPFKNSLRIGFYLQAIRVVIANMNIEIVYQVELPFKQVYQFGNP